VFGLTEQVHRYYYPHRPLLLNLRPS
jgi:hypothetical protein